MSKRAEQAALKAYPEKDALNKKATGHYDPNYQRRKAYQQGYEKAEEELIPPINQLCEAILFEWKDAADLARKTLTQIKTREE